MAGPADVRLLAARAGLAAGQRVADLCCGMGGPTVQMATEYGCQMIAVDWSRQAVDLAVAPRRRGPLAHRLRFCVGDVGTPPFADGVLHAVVSVDGFYFGVDLPALYAEVFRVLRPGGRFAFYFNVPTQEVVDASPPSGAPTARATASTISRRCNAAGSSMPAPRTARRERSLLTPLLQAYTSTSSGLRAEIGLRPGRGAARRNRARHCT